MQQSLAQALSERDLPVLAADPTQRVAYASTAAQGKTVFDGPPTVARRGMEAIREEVKEMLL